MPNVKATKALQKRTDAAVESFNKYYASIWGYSRWHDSLFPALSQPTRYCALLNRFGEMSNVEIIAPKDADASIEGLVVSSTGNARELEAATNLFVKQGIRSLAFSAPFRVSTSSGTDRKVLSHWNLDLASVLAASMLQVGPGDRVLDLCAAPGGKSIVLAQMLWPEIHGGPAVSDLNSQTCLHSNESDQTRNKRLAANLESYLPQRLFADKAVKVVRIDASEKSSIDDLPLGVCGYDKVLLDAPCSSERHIMHAHLKASSAGQVAEEMMNWKSSHSKTLAKTQAALLMTALRAVKAGGSVLYATCSISTEENDDVIERTLEAVRRERKKNAGSSHSSWKIKFDVSVEEHAETKTLLDGMTEKTKYGRIALPDHPAGGQWGPLYFCLMQKVPSASKMVLNKQAEE